MRLQYSLLQIVDFFSEIRYLGGGGNHHAASKKEEKLSAPRLDLKNEPKKESKRKRRNRKRQASKRKRAGFKRKRKQTKGVKRRQYWL